MKLVIFGANGPTGRLLTKQAVNQGDTVTAVTRHAQAFPLRQERLQVMSGDVFNLEAVEQAVRGQDAVVSILGVPYSNKPITIYSQGTSHIIQAMTRYRVCRLICVSSSALDPYARYRNTGGGLLFEKIMKPIILNVLGRTAYEDLERMEALVRNSEVDWTIVRSSGLFDTLEVTDYQVGEGYLGRYTSRADLADCLLQQVMQQRYLHKTVAVVTVSVQPNMLQTIMKEAFQKRP